MNKPITLSVRGYLACRYFVHRFNAVTRIIQQSLFRVTRITRETPKHALCVILYLFLHIPPTKSSAECRWTNDSPTSETTVSESNSYARDPLRVENRTLKSHQKLPGCGSHFCSDGGERNDVDNIMIFFAAATELSILKFLTISKVSPFVQ